MRAVVIVWAATLWALWSCWLLAQHLNAPAAITRVSAGLLVAELVTLAVHSFGCTDHGCGPAAAAAGSAASLDVPILAALFIAAVAAREWQRARRAVRIRLHDSNPPRGQAAAGEHGAR
jgi:hypothetical protein